MSALVIVVIAVAVLMGLIGFGVVAGSGRARRHEERRIHAEELRRESEFHDARAEQGRAEAEQRMARARREEAAARERLAEAEEHARQAEERARDAEGLDPDDTPRSGRFERRPEASAADEEVADDSPESLPGPRDER